MVRLLLYSDVGTMGGDTLVNKPIKKKSSSDSDNDDDDIYNGFRMLGLDRLSSSMNTEKQIAVVSLYRYDLEHFTSALSNLPEHISLRDEKVDE